MIRVGFRCDWHWGVGSATLSLDFVTSPCDKHKLCREGELNQTEFGGATHSIVDCRRGDLLLLALEVLLINFNDIDVICSVFINCSQEGGTIES